MSKKVWRISLRHFMIGVAVVPAVLALAAGVFGHLAALLFWIGFAAVLWFGLSGLVILGVTRGARYLAKGSLDGKQRDETGELEKGMTSISE